MTTWTNQLELDEDCGDDNLDNDIVWRLDDSGSEFWNDNHPNSQFLFLCGPKEIGGDVSRSATIAKALAPILPDFIWAASWEPNKYVFYHKEAEVSLKKSLTFDDSLLFLRELMADNEIVELVPE